MIDEEIQNVAERYLNQGELASFAEGFADLYLRVRQDQGSSQKARRFCDSMIAPLAEISNGHRAAESFRLELENAIRPFRIVQRVGEPHGYEVPIVASGTSVRADVPPGPLEQGTAATSWAPFRVRAA